MADRTSLQNQEIGILGCGWLGLALGTALVKAGAFVSGSTTSQHKLDMISNAGIKPYLIDLRTEIPVPAAFTAVKTLVVAIPPKAENAAYQAYLYQINNLAAAIVNSGIRQLVFVSSTGVYPENAEMVTEQAASPHSERALALLTAEEIMRQIPGIRATVIRFGGLFGPDRHPGKFLAGKINVPNSQAPINFIHQADAVALMQQIIALNTWGETFSACADGHPTRLEFYTTAAGLAGLAPPKFNTHNQANPTVVNSEKIKQALSYSFLFPDPLAALHLLPAPQNSDNQSIN